MNNCSKCPNANISECVGFQIHRFCRCFYKHEHNIGTKNTHKVEFAPTARCRRDKGWGRIFKELHLYSPTGKDINQMYELAETMHDSGASLEAISFSTGLSIYTLRKQYGVKHHA